MLTHLALVLQTDLQSFLSGFAAVCVMLHEYLKHAGDSMPSYYTVILLQAIELLLQLLAHIQVLS